VEANVRILVVDDFEESRDITEAALTSLGYSDLLLADSASVALDILYFWHPNVDVNVDVVLLDIMMPKIDGIETCARIRTDARYADLPIIMLTSLEDMDSLVDSFIAGATDFIAKPFSPTELVARMQTAAKSTKKKSTSRDQIMRIRFNPLKIPGVGRLWMRRGLDQAASFRRFSAATRDCRLASVGPAAIIAISIVVGGLIVSVMTSLLSVSQIIG
jgi:DNA-binding response OmpR family regulator